MPLLLQARITSVSFEEARYRHYRSQQRREGALRKAAAQVRKRAPSPFDEDAAQATRRLFARTVAQVVEIHALERTFDAWRSLEARPKAPPSLPARPATNGAPDETKYDPRALDLGARLAQRVLDDRISRSRLQQWSSITKRPASPALSSLTEDFVVVEDAAPPPPPIESPVSPALSDQRRELADVIAKNCGLVALCRSLSRRRRADAFQRWASRHRTEHTNGLESALFEAQRTLDARRTLVALDDAWRRRRRERLRRVIGTWRALSAAGNIAAAEALRDELDDMREQLGKVTRERDAAKAALATAQTSSAGDAAAATTLRGELASVTEERDAAREELATAATRVESLRGDIDSLSAERDAANAALEADVGAAMELRGELEAMTEERDAARRELEARSGDADERITRAREAADEARAEAVRRAVAAADARAEAALDERRRRHADELEAARRRAVEVAEVVEGDAAEAERIVEAARAEAEQLRGEVERLQAELAGARAEGRETSATAAEAAEAVADRARTLDRRRSLAALEASWRRRRRESVRSGFLKLGEAGRANQHLRTKLTALSDACERRRRDRMRRVLARLTTSGADGALKAARNAWARGNVSRRLEDAKRTAFYRMRCGTLEQALASERRRADTVAGDISAAEFTALDASARRERSDAAAASSQAAAARADAALARAVADAAEAAAASGEQVQNAALAEERASTERARLEQLLVDAKMEIVHLKAAMDAIQPSERASQYSSAPPSEASELGEAPPTLPPRSRVGRLKSAAASARAFASRRSGREK